MGRGAGVNWQGIGRTAKGDGMRRFLLTLWVSVVLAGCAVDEIVTREVAAATLTLTPAPSVTSTPSPALAYTPTPTPLASPTPISPTEEPVEFQATATPRATSTRRPTLTPTPVEIYASMSEPLVSRLGQLAYVHNQTVWVETAPGSAVFQNLGQYATEAHWSQDGTKLLFAQAEQPQAYPFQDSLPLAYPEDFGLYFAETAETWFLSEHIQDFPSSPEILETCPQREPVNALRFRFMNWSPDGSKLLLGISRNGDVNDLITVVDFETRKHTVLLNCVDTKLYVEYVTDTVFVTRYHCGAPCQIFSGYDYEGNLIWELPWQVGATFAQMPDEQYFINMGHFLPRDDPLWTINLIELNTGEITNLVPLVELPEESYFDPMARPAFSPDGHFIGFYYSDVDYDKPSGLYIIDRQGNLIEQWVDSEVIDWRPGGGPVIRQGMGEAEYQLVYSALNGAAATPITTTSNPITVGRWSPDGQFFIYTDGDEVYLWRPGDAEPRLVYSGIAKRYDLLRDFTWTPDSRRIYFTINELELWVYEVATGEVRLIAAAEPWFVSQ